MGWAVLAASCGGGCLSFGIMDAPVKARRVADMASFKAVRQQSGATAIERVQLFWLSSFASQLRHLCEGYGQVRRSYCNLARSSELVCCQWCLPTDSYFIKSSSYHFSLFS